MTKNHKAQIISAAVILLAAGSSSGCRPQAGPSADTTPKDESILQAGKLPKETIYTVPGLESFTFQATSNTDSLAGVNYGIERYTNSAGSYLIQPSNGVAHFTFSDISGLPAPYNSQAIAIEQKHGIIYGTNSITNSITFPVTNTDSYKLTVFILNPPPPPTNGQVITLKLLQNYN